MFKVENAIIMAAGKSSRFIPLSYEKPKSLWPVNGEIMIERQIKQLQEVGINDITIVVGYMKEKFMYLADKYDVEIIENDDYIKYNNTSTLIRVLDKINNTYICSSDNYFVDNPFRSHMKHSTYPVITMKNEPGEYYATFNENLEITRIEIGTGEYAMIGHVFFDEFFSKEFKKLLEKEYVKVEVKENLWEKLYKEHIDSLPPMHVEYFDENILLEFDSFDELLEFEPNYANQVHIQILNDIAKEYNCQPADIHLIQSTSETSFTFKIKHKPNTLHYKI